tara:strand:- start:383 stop:691 length:309 start_codon:yes stop_codon:yes gene_type:complete
MSRQPHVLSEYDIEFVKLCAADGLPLKTTAIKLDIHPNTLASALDRQGLGEWRKKAFPAKAGWGTTFSQKGRKQDLTSYSQGGRAKAAAAALSNNLGERHGH